jgi:hypothetical protein
MSTPPSASGTVPAGPILEKAIKSLKATFKAEHDDDTIKYNLGRAWLNVHNVYKGISMAGGTSQNERLKELSDFENYVKSGSEGERKLIALLRSMAEGQEPWIKLFENGTSLSSL